MSGLSAKTSSCGGDGSLSFLTTGTKFHRAQSEGSLVEFMPSSVGCPAGNENISLSDEGGDVRGELLALMLEEVRNRRALWESGAEREWAAELQSRPGAIE